ncbi:MAG TPA: glutamate decarboxylase [Clostridia bacterium]|nr:glutamate decarboxylase [Clostridia bacterium]
MWTVVYIVPNRTMAESLKDALADEGLLVMLRAAGSLQLGEAGAVEILVPESEAEEAHEVISKKLSRC